MTTFLAKRKCPSCGCDECQVVTASRLPAEQVALSDLRNHWNGFFKENVFFTYHRCSVCSTLYAPSYFTGDVLADLYSNMPDNTAGLPREIMELTQRGYHKEFSRHSSQEGVYGEIGPDIGLFTKYIAQNGKFSQYILWEPNRGVHGEIGKLLKDRDYRISTDMFDLGAAPDHSLSALVMIHVLDHMLNPREFMERAFVKLAKGGVVLIVTHDERSLLARVVGRRWPAYCLQHPQLYSQKSMRKFLESLGLKVKDIVKSYNYFPVGYLLKHALWAVGIRWISIPNINVMSIPLKLGNILTVAVKE